MRPKLKPIAEQVVVLTGASSGIGLATARLLSRRGARLVLGGRSEGALATLAAEIGANGGRAVFVAGDVADPATADALAAAALATFGGFDTWINNAGISAYGRVGDMPVDDGRRIFEVNFWGLVAGTRVALAHLRGRGGAVINLGSEVSERGLPLQAFYSASKHAVKGYTEALRAELEADGVPVALTLIKPGPIDTPFPVNAKNFLPSEPRHSPPPVYAPEVVARAILRATEHDLRDVTVGGAARVTAILAHLAPGLTDRLLERTTVPGTPSGRIPRRRAGESGLERPTESLETRGNYPGRTRETSVYTEAATRPAATAAALAATALALRALWRGRPRRRAILSGAKGARLAPKGLHVTLEARRGREGALLDAIGRAGAAVRSEGGGADWTALRGGRRRFEVFEIFPDERRRRARLAGGGTEALLRGARALLARPARIRRLDVVDTGAAGE